MRLYPDDFRMRDDSCQNHGSAAGVLGSKACSLPLRDIIANLDQSFAQLAQAARAYESD